MVVADGLTSVLPDMFLRVQVGTSSGKEKEFEGRLVGQPGLNGGSGMPWSAVEQDEQGTVR